ncbi:MAG: 2-succinyl-5-enolpyruvyl-6-hydroxy-3-cyclohexene-carboxylate synthase [Thermoleophilaceae bacterium]|nr:2-succinyl-5-enolpyruvyl-6-hydroxy-3-cyclohexene-carboxylate synthase [Thermoleophilaceae bacterium]
MIPVNRTYAPLQALTDELARCGMTHAVTSPGSRNAPLVLTLAADPRIHAISMIDERSAGFVALGVAKSTGRPVAVTCTSGSAAANLLPAVVEAHEARVPLVVLTADRPPELRDTGAGQAIDQVKLYGSFAKWFVEVGNFAPGRETAVHFRALACRAWHTARGGRPGVVHLNLGLREPLAPIPEELDPADWEGRPDGGPWVQLHAASPAPSRDLVAGMASRSRDVRSGAIVCGSAGEGVAEEVAALAAATGWPVLADPLSGLRCGPHDRSHVISHYDVLLRSSAWAAAHRPDLILRIGDTPTSKPLRAWLAESAQLVVDPHAVWHEPTRVAETIVQAAPGPLCAALAGALAGAEPDQDWLASWRRADELVPAALAATPDTFEPRAWAAAAEAAPEGSTLWVASSMPVRDVETFVPSTGKRLRFLSNRGANGIDGTASSALGAALAGTERVILLTGELALLHDLGGLVAARRAGAELTIVCANNGGGGIFDFLPLAGAADPALYAEHILTPAGVELEQVAALAGLEHRLATTAAAVAGATAAGPGLIEIRTDRAESVRLHRDLFARVAEAL